MAYVNVRKLGQIGRVETVEASVAEQGPGPESFLLPDRAEGTPCPRCGGTIERTEVSGRSTYVCPDHQGRS